jgi:hypothetical protein
MSVYYSSNQYQVLVRCVTAEQIKSWIRGRPAFQRKRKRPDNMPSVSSVLTISAPNVLLSASVYAFVVGYGLYLGFIWTEDLDGDAAPGDSRRVFITFLVVASVCYSVYWLSILVVWTDDEFEEDMTRGSGASCDILDETQSQGGQQRNEKTVSMTQMTGVAPDSRTGNRVDGTLPFEGREVAQAMREAARLRRELANADDRVAFLLESLAPVRSAC